MNSQMMRLRSAMNRTIRAFFDSLGYLEVDTPLLSPDLIPETAIDIFVTRYESGYDRAEERDLYLIPSPEIWMKKLLSEGSGSCYQICRSFRNREQMGRLHNPEFTMLEWYETEANYKKSMTTTEEFFKALLPLGADPSWGRPFQKISMEEAFREYTGEDILPWCRPGEEGLAALTEGIKRLGHEGYTASDWEEGFNLLFVHHVEPQLPKDKPLILYDYPRNIPTLAADKPDSPWSERWELYVGGCELANCFTEERNPEKVKAYYAKEAPFKALGASREQSDFGGIPEKAPSETDRFAARRHKVDYDFHRFFHPDFPPVSGVAMGLDRLLMLIAGKNDLRGVILFSFPDRLDRH